MKPNPVCVEKHTHSANASLSSSPQEVNTLCSVFFILLAAFEFESKSQFLSFLITHFSLAVFSLCDLKPCGLIYFSPLFPFLTCLFAFLLHTLPLCHTHTGDGELCCAQLLIIPHPVLSVSCLHFHCSPWQENSSNLRAMLIKLNFSSQTSSEKNKPGATHFFFFFCLAE